MNFYLITQPTVNMDISNLSRSVQIFARLIFYALVALAMHSYSANAFDIYIPQKGEFKLTDKGGGNYVTETKTWLDDDYHVVLHFMDMFGLPDTIPDDTMNEEKAVLATNAKAIGTDLALFELYKGHNWGDRKELEPDADFGTIYYKKFDAKKPNNRKCVSFFSYDTANIDVIYGIYCKARKLTDQEAILALRSITVDEEEATKPEMK